MNGGRSHKRALVLRAMGIAGGRLGLLAPCLSLTVLAFCALLYLTSPTYQTVQLALCPSKNGSNQHAGSAPASRSRDSGTCPKYFRNIHKDLAPWRTRGGISLEAVTNAQPRAAMRVQIIKGNLFVHEYWVCFQTRSIFTLWGILQLLQRYPGKVPDVDFMLECEDMPVFRRSSYAFHLNPPLLFRFCTTNTNLEVLWPDFSFWGWPEILIYKWDKQRQLIRNGTAAVPWEERLPFAQWKGNVETSELRMALKGCSAPVHAEHIEWRQATQEAASRLQTQCTHRYKIYVEGRSWSCSLKYVLACASTVLFVESPYVDFYSRALEEGVHYLPIALSEERSICDTIKEAVEWGEAHAEQARRIGSAGSAFVEEELSMDVVYMYMLHLLREYHSLQRFQPQRVPDAMEVTMESVLSSSPAEGEFFRERVQVAAEEPCTLEPPEENGAALWA